MLHNDILVYGGESAGAVIVGPSLEGLDIIDNATDVPNGYLTKFSMQGLGLVDYMIAPHYKSDHLESSSIDKLVRYFQDKKMPYKTLRDGEVIIIDGLKEKIYSQT